MNNIWNEIRSDYENAKNALWCPKKAGGWHRDEETGRYYMWRAYHLAAEAEPKDNLLYARVLSMMASENRISCSDYDRYHKYLKPALDAYDQAARSGQCPTDKELDIARFTAESIKYVLEQEESSYDEQIRLIDGYEKLDDFGFHDSKPVWFEHTEDTARLRLQYGEVTATFLFEGVMEFRADGDPMTNWIMDFFCYPCFHNKELLTFDVGYYKIICSSISVERVEAGNKCDEQSGEAQ